MTSFRKTSVQDFQHQIKDIRTQLSDQLKCLEQRSDVQTAILGEVNDFLKKKAELDADYAKQLDKLVKSVMLKHKNEKQKRSSWALYSTCQLWQQLVDDAKEEARQRGTTAEVYANHVAPAIAQRSAALAKISKKCRELGALAQAEVIRVLDELQTAMKTYQLCFAQFNALSAKLQQAEAQRNKLLGNQQQGGGSTRKQRSVQKTYDKKSMKYDAARLKCTRSRNEYLLCIDAANASLHKYFADDISDLVDCSDLGMDWWVCLVLQNMIAARKSACQVEMNALANLGSFKESLQSLVDKQRFFESNHQAFMLPKRFDFKCEDAERVAHISVAEGTLADEFRQRHHQIRKRLGTLKAESELSWQNMEGTERQIRDLLSACTVVEVTEFGIASNDDRRPSVVESLESELTKAYDSYMQTFSYYLFNANLIMRLEARADGIGNALASADPQDNDDPKCQLQHGDYAIGQPIDSAVSKSGPSSSIASSTIGGQQNVGIEKREPSEPPGPPDSLEWAQRRRKMRIGSQASTELAPLPSNPTAATNPQWRRPRLFGGSLEEYTELTGEPIPLVVVSCIRVLSQYALHHQGIFRISGSQLEINHMREAFELGEDPLRDVQDASDANSIAGVLKLYLRELREPLFPFYLFDLLTDCAKCASTDDFVGKICPLLNKLPRATYLLLRYLFTFLNHLSEFSDENMMDPYNLAICFGPTLLPIPEGKDQVYYQNSVNEVVKNLIVHSDAIFTARVPGPRYEKYALESTDATPAGIGGDLSTELELYMDEEEELLSSATVAEQPQQPPLPQQQQQQQQNDGINWSSNPLHHQQQHNHNNSRRLSTADLPFPPPSPQFHRFHQQFKQQPSPQQPQQRLPFLANHQQPQHGQQSSESTTMMDWSMCSANSSLLGGGTGEALPNPTGAQHCYQPPQKQQQQQQFPTNNNNYCYSSSESGIGDANANPKPTNTIMNGNGGAPGSHSPQQQHLVRRGGAEVVNPVASDLYASIHKNDRLRRSAAAAHQRPPPSSSSSASVQRTQSHEPPSPRLIGPAYASASTGGGISPPPYAALYGSGRSPPIGPAAASVTERKTGLVSPPVPSPTRRRNSSLVSSSASGTTASSLSGSGGGAASSGVLPVVASTSVSVLQQQPQATTAVRTPTTYASIGQPPASAAVAIVDQQLKQQRLEQISAIDELLGKLSTAAGTH